MDEVTLRVRLVEMVELSLCFFFVVGGMLGLNRLKATSRVSLNFDFYYSFLESHHMNILFTYL